MRSVVLCLGWLLLMPPGAVCAAEGSRISVGGAVARPGTVELRDGMTLGESLGKVGFDPALAAKAERHPFRLTLYRKGRPAYFTSESAIRHATAMKAENGDVLVVETPPDQGRVADAKERLEKALALGSTETTDALTDLARLRLAKARWPEPPGDGLKTLEPQLKAELARLAAEGRGWRVSQLLALRRDGLLVQGLGEAHPAVVGLDQLLLLSREAEASRPQANVPAVPRSLVFTGMYLVELEERMREFGGQSTMYQVFFKGPDDHPEQELHYFHLADGPVLSLISEPGIFKHRRVVSMEISTYQPKSWDAKDDPERDKFFASFKAIEEVDLAAKPAARRGP